MLHHRMNSIKNPSDVKNPLDTGIRKIFQINNNMNIFQKRKKKENIWSNIMVQEEYYKNCFVQYCERGIQCIVQTEEHNIDPKSIQIEIIMDILYDEFQIWRRNFSCIS